MLRFAIVDEERIAQGRQWSAAECPVALALNSITGHRWFVGWTYARERFDFSNPHPHVYYNSAELTMWIAMYDKGMEVKPIEIRINDVEARLEIRH